MRTALRSVLVVNRAGMTGTAMILTFSAALLTTTGVWLEAGLREENLRMLVTLASSFAGTIVLISMFLVSGVFSAALRPRRREFALMRAIGATPAQVRSAVTAEAVVLLLVTIPIGAAAGTYLARVLSPMLVSSGIVPTGFDLPLSVFPAIAALAVLAPTGIIAARLTTRQIVRVGPSEAVKDSALDPTEISRVRVVAAAVLAILGILAAGTPFVAPGTLGAAGGASSVIVLITAAALAGPALVRWCATRGARVLGTPTGAESVLACANARGFSRRLSVAIVPLALLIALGSVQSGADSAMTAATEQQLREGIGTDLVALSHTEITVDQIAAAAALPGVSTVTATGHLGASVRTDPPEDIQVLDRLAWEASSILAITPGEPLIDPAVRSGSLRALGGEATIAVSRDALLFTGKGVGDTVDVRMDGGEESTRTIVAIYDRGLAFGDYIVSTSGIAVAATGFDTLFIGDAGDTRPETVDALAEIGLTANDAEGYVRGAVEGGSGEQNLSLVLLFGLLGFVAIAAANTLATSMSGRQREFALLRRLGATRAQILGMLARETAFIAVAAVGIGVLAALPALVGIGQGLLGSVLPVFDAPVVLGLIATTIVITIVSVAPAAWRSGSGSSA